MTSSVPPDLRPDPAGDRRTNDPRSVVGREAERESLGAFLDDVREGPAGLVLRGEPGIGKTALWRGCLQTARSGFRVLSSRPVESEARLTFGALDDLLEEVLDETLPALADPKRHALEAALLRTDPRGRPPDRRTVFRAVLDALRLLAERQPLILAVDDVQWLDLPSGRAIEFVARRLEGDRIGILLARRLEGKDRSVPLALDRALPEDRLRVVDLGPLQMASVHELIRTRFGATFPRHVLVRLFEQSGGNPFYALEIAKDLLAHEGLPAPGEPLPVPDTLGALLRSRITHLSPEARDLLVAAAALAQPTVELVVRTQGGARHSGPLEEASEAGVIQLEGERIRFSHPLLASVAYMNVSAKKRRSIHRGLAETVKDPEQRARHLALASTGPDPAIAAALDQATQAAAARGAIGVAAILSEEARRLTPADQEDLANPRQIQAADYHFLAGDTARARELLEDVLSRSPPGPGRGAVLYRLGRIRAQEESWSEAADLLSAALGEAGSDLPLRITLHLQMAMTRMVTGDLGEAVLHSREASTLSREVEDGHLRAYAQGAEAWFEFLLGRGLRADLLQRAQPLWSMPEQVPSTLRPLMDPAVVVGILYKWTDDFAKARGMFEERYHHALDTGDESLLPFILYHLSELECWAGDWARAARWAEEGNKVALLSEQEGVRSAALYSRALVTAHMGLADPARADAEEALRLSQRSENVPVMTLALSVLGFVELSLDNFDRVHDRLGPIASRLAAMGVMEPGVVRFLPDEIEAMIVLGEFDQATVLVDQLEDRGRALDRIWALATGARCRALLDAANGDIVAADRALQRAIEQHQRLAMPFELARTLLASGAIYRRAKQKRRAKESLERSLMIFEDLGATLWAVKARKELARVGLRRADPLELTESERQVAELVSTGRTNKQVADALFISPKTVESNLSKIYRKLGVSSRTELAARLSSAEADHSS